MTTATNSQAYELMLARKSVRAYDSSFKISKEEIEELLEQATSAPSSSNLQPWRFLVIQDEAVKKELRAIANNQEQVETASAIIAVLGDVEMYTKAEQINAANVAQGFMTEEIKQFMVQSSMNLYSKAPVEVRKNIATFDAGLVSMQIMLLAKEKGYDTVPMGGFDKAKFAERFQLAENTFPAVLIAVGKAAKPARDSSRLPIKEIVSFI